MVGISVMCSGCIFVYFVERNNSYLHAHSRLNGVGLCTYMSYHCFLIFFQKLAMDLSPVLSFYICYRRRSGLIIFIVVIDCICSLVYFFTTNLVL